MLRLETDVGFTITAVMLWATKLLLAEEILASDRAVTQFFYQRVDIPALFYIAHSIVHEAFVSARLLLLGICRPLLVLYGMSIIVRLRLWIYSTWSSNRRR